MFELNGPFGKVSGNGTRKIIYKCIPVRKRKKTSTHVAKFKNLLPHPSFLNFGKMILSIVVHVAFFLFNMLITQALNTWKIKMASNSILSESFKLGSSVMSPEFHASLWSDNQILNVKDHLKKLYNLYR